jgi:hypothetical protein
LLWPAIYPLAFAEPQSGAAAVLVDELNAGPKAGGMPLGTSAGKRK